MHVVENMTIEFITKNMAFQQGHVDLLYSLWIHCETIICKTQLLPWKCKKRFPYVKVTFPTHTSFGQDAVMTQVLFVVMLVFYWRDAHHYG